MLIMVLSFTGCGNKALEAANEAVDNYNAEVSVYNETIAPYNSIIQEITAKNQELQDVVNAAQDALNKGETPFDETTTATLKDAMAAALDSKISVPEAIPAYNELAVNENAKRDELEAITAQATADIEAMKAFTLPDMPAVPDYSDAIQNVVSSLQAYEDSVQGLKQITAPSDDFVMERLQRIDTITAMEAVTEDHDPNGKLNKQGGYIGCIYFRDTQVDWSQLFIPDGEDTVIDVGCDGGGAIEIFENVDDAQSRDTYLGGFDGTAFASGSHYVYGTIIVRTSDELSGTKQLELPDKIVQALISVE